MKNRKYAAIASLAPFMLLVLASCANNNPVDCPDCAEKPAAQRPFEYFAGLSAIPRCSYDEKAASYFLAAFGHSRGFEVYQDSMFNTLVRKGGSAGREHEPPIILQAHMDMVCRKDDDVEHDFTRDPIIPVTDGDRVTARKRTTLGADDGSGVSMIMAILASSGISHPPIEALFTVQEEIGLVGAEYFDVSRLNGRRLINIDLTTEGVFVVSSKRDDGPDIIIPLDPRVLAKMAALPDWDYREDSPLRDTMVKVFRGFYGSEPLMAGINNNRAGVECLVFANKAPDMDMVSIGVDILDIHTPNESMSLSSLNRVYDYLVRVLGEI